MVNTSVSAMLTGLFFAIAALALRMIFLRFVDQYTLDEHGLVHKHGIITRHTQSIQLSAVRSVELKQSILQRILRVGDIQIYSSASDSAEVKFSGILHPVKAQNKIQKMLQQVKEQPVKEDRGR
mgnify:CR=1 FL=1